MSQWWRIKTFLDWVSALGARFALVESRGGMGVGLNAWAIAYMAHEKTLVRCHPVVECLLSLFLTVLCGRWLLGPGSPLNATGRMPLEALRGSDMALMGKLVGSGRPLFAMAWL